MATNSCLVYPQVNGEDSKMYKEMLKIVKDRPRVNWLYAKYMASNVADVMDKAGYKRNSQGEFNAKDALRYLDHEDMQRDISTLHQAELQLGAIDANGNRADFTDAKTALEEAYKFNEHHKGLVATVYQHNDIFNIHVSEKNSRTFMQPTDVKERLAVWEVYKQAFNSIGVDIENLPTELKSTFNAYNTDIVQRLINLQNTNFQYLFKQDALILLNLDPTSTLVQRCINSFGSIDETAQAINDINHHTGNYTQAQVDLAKKTITHCQKIQNLNLKDLQNQVASMSLNVHAKNPEADIKDTLHKLKKKYNIEINEIHLVGDKIKTLSQATAEAAIQIQRQIRDIENNKGDLVEGKKKEVLLNQLMRELSNKKYYAGILNFLAEAQKVQADIDNLIVSAPQSGTELEKAFQRARNLMKIKSYRDQYYTVVSALANEHTIIDESIGKTDIDNLRKVAKDFITFFDKKDEVIRDLAEDNMQVLLMEIIGTTAPDGQVIANIVKMAQSDSSLFNYLYSVGRASNPMIAAMGSIIRQAQGERDAVMNGFSRRIRRATDKLYKAGEKNTEFMYEDEEYIISDIDWKGYKAARKAEMKNLSKQGLSGFDFRIALQNWEEANTEDRVVDIKTGRTERVPDSKFRKAFPKLSQAQLEYYNDMMQIKGEIGSYLPAYAQKQYLAPQLRRNMVDALSKAKNASDVWKTIKNKGQNIYRVREDDTDFAKNGVIDGEEYVFSPGAFDNTPLQKIPIFFINKVEEGELLKDFSTGLQHLAGTAINYDAMNSIASVVEFMGDFIKYNVGVKDFKNRSDVVNNKMVSVVKDLYQWGKSNKTADIVDGFIAYHIRGEKMNPKENSGLQKLFSNLIGYTSFKGLATNFKGALSNYLVGEFQMLVEAGCGEFYGLKDYAWAHSKLFGGAGVGGEIMELVTNNMRHKATLFREMFDPLQENFSDKSRERYFNSHRVGGIFRHIISKDCSFIGYTSGEYLIHYVNMYAILNHEKVKDANGNIISLYDAFEVGNVQDNNAELLLKQGITKVDGSPIDQTYIESIRNKIRYANQSTHGSMNSEDKGLIHRRILGRMVMNFRQWMVEHYSRRFRGRHFDAALAGLTYEDGSSMAVREGYWWTVIKSIFKEGEGGEAWQEKQYAKAIALFLRDIALFTIRAQSQWSNLDTMQKYNVKRAHSELMMYLALLGLSCALGEPDEHKKEFWRRWWIYQTKRMILDTESAMPHPHAPESIWTILQSPIPSISIVNSFFYVFMGIDDITEEIKSGPHKGENKYWRNVKKNVLPFYKDWEQMQNMDTSDAVFMPFDTANPNK